MKLSISNLAWNEPDNDTVFEYLKNNDFSGIEIAPKKIFPLFPDASFDDTDRFKLFLQKKYNLSVVSIQAIWFGRAENIFSSEAERKCILDYTKKIILFAERLKCPNIVFGCPKNRSYTGEYNADTAHSFFYELGNFAANHDTIIAIEPNPVIYNTNFLNTTAEAIDFVKKTACDGLKINLDLGTILYNNEKIENLTDDILLINHIHISEPNLELIQKRQLHTELADFLKKNHYENFISIEMKYQENIDTVKKTIQYIKSIFGEHK